MAITVFFLLILLLNHKSIGESRFPKMRIYYLQIENGQYLLSNP